MKSHRPSWFWLGAAFAALPCVAAAQLRAAPVRPGGNRPASFGQLPRPSARQAQEQDHLQRWMERRSNLTLPQLLHELESDPAFRSYPPAEQMRLRNLLVRLYNMRPQQRDHLLEGNEALERMTPAQRQQFTGTMQQYTALPAERRRLVAQVFARLRRVPPPNRQAAIDSEAMRAQLRAFSHTL